MNELETKQRIEKSLACFSHGNLLENGIHLLNTLGYHSERQVTLSPNTFAGLVDIHPSIAKINLEKALVNDWLSVDILFQLTGDDIREVAQGHFIFENVHRVDNQIIESYLFLAIHLKQDEYGRAKLADITREVNKFFAMPVMILFQHGDCLTLSLINRRLNKHEESKDVLEKVTLIKEISYSRPLRAHTEILFDLSLEPLQKESHFQNFVELHHAWQKTLDTSELNKKFYREVAGWYFWAVKQVQFPTGGVADVETRNATNVIRLITRLIFVWFIKEKGLVPEELFDPGRLKDILKDSDLKGSTYYKAILQNLFFATLNTEMGADRRFRGKNHSSGRDAHYGISTVYRYEADFKDPATALNLFAGIPFLNGGLFECLDKREEKLLVDGFSDDPRNQPIVPNELFFGDEHIVDLSEVYDDIHHSHDKVRGLIQIFNSYKFTIEENTPLEEEIALDPELLGKVFENLLAAYNPETGTTARKQTGSFYTPREIVNYMVDEALIAYLEKAFTPILLPEGGGQAIQSRLRHLLAYNQEPHQFSEEEEQRLITVIDTVKVLDPACGSGAFPMGVLHKLVFILSKLDPGNQHWKQKQIDKASEIPDPNVRERVIEDIEKSFSENELDYGRKLYLIENCIYGVDIQPIAVQIAKLRFFISLVVDQKTDRSKPNLGIRPLPNLETKIVAANSLISIERPKQIMLHNLDIDEKEKQLDDTRDALFTARTPGTKHKYRDLDKLLRTEIATLLGADGWGSDAAAQLARWDPYDQNTSAEFFDSKWMFGVADGFDIVIGNPPYINVELISRRIKDIYARIYCTFYKRYDVFGLFFELGLTKLVRQGTIAFIVPSQVLNNLSFKKLRELVLNNHWLKEVFYLGDKVFEAANNDVCILFLYKPRVSSIRLVNALDFENRVTSQVDVDYFNKYKGILSFAAGSSTDSISEKIFNPSNKPIRDNFEVFQGIVTGNNELFVLTSEQAREVKIESEILHPVLLGRDFEKWMFRSIDRKIIYIDGDTKIKKYPNTEKWLLPNKLQLEKRRECINGVIPWFALQWARDKSKLDYIPKILVQSTRNQRLKTRIVATIDLIGVYGTQGLNFILAKNSLISIKSLLAILNSSLINYLYKTKFLNVAIKAEYLKNTPIPIVTPEQQGILNIAVENILIAKRTDPSIDTSSMEREIDRLVCELYELNQEEIAIVEGRE